MTKIKGIGGHRGQEVELDVNANTTVQSLEGEDKELGLNAEAEREPAKAQEE